MNNEPIETPSNWTEEHKKTINERRTRTVERARNLDQLTKLHEKSKKKTSLLPEVRKKRYLLRKKIIAMTKTMKELSEDEENKFSFIFHCDLAFGRHDGYVMISSCSKDYEKTPNEEWADYARRIIEQEEDKVPEGFKKRADLPRGNEEDYSEGDKDIVVRLYDGDDNLIGYCDPAQAMGHSPI